MRYRKLSTICLTILSGILLVAGCTTTPATPTPTAVKPGAAVKLVFTTQPGGAASASALSTQPVVTIQDADGNTVTSSILPVTLTITPGTGTSSAAIFGPSTINAVKGVAKFTDISIDKAGTGYTLTASSSTLASATTSAPFNISSGAAAKLEFTVQPGGVRAGELLSPQPEVTVKDIYGNKITDYQSSVTLNIPFGTSPSTARIGGTSTVNAVNGVAKFTDISITRSWTAYTLMATSGALSSDTSIAFAVSAAVPAKLEVTVHPAKAKAGSPFEEQPIVAVEDTYGNVVTSSTLPITVALTPGTGTSGAVLNGTKTLNADVGLARYEDLAIDRAGTGYTLTATSSGLTSAVSQPFDVASK